MITQYQMRQAVFVAVLVGVFTWLVGCDSSGPAPPERELSGTYAATHINDNLIPFLAGEGRFFDTETNRSVLCETWFNEDAFVLTFETLGAAALSRTETRECTSVDAPFYSYTSKPERTNPGRYSRVGQEVEIIWEELEDWTGEVSGDRIVFSIAFSVADSSTITFRKQ